MAVTYDGFSAAFGNGTARHIRDTINPQVFDSLIIGAGGEVVSNDSI